MIRTSDGARAHAAGQRRRAGDQAGVEGPGVRAVLHDEGSRARDGPGAVDFAGHRDRARRRLDAVRHRGAPVSVDAAAFQAVQPAGKIVRRPVPHRARVLVVEDEASIRGLLGRLLARRGYAVAEATAVDEALRASGGASTS